MDVLQRNDHALIGRDIHPCDAGHDFTPVAAGLGLAVPACCCNVPTQGPASGNATPSPCVWGRHRANCVRLNTEVIKGFIVTSSTSARAQVFWAFFGLWTPWPAWRGSLDRLCGPEPLWLASPWLA